MFGMKDRVYAMVYYGSARKGVGYNNGITHGLELEAQNSSENR